MTLYDKTGREMMEGDLFRVLHFRDRRRRDRYLYFFLEFHPELTLQWWGVDIRGGWNKHRFPVCDGYEAACEIVNSLIVTPPDGNYDDFMDRPRNRKILEQRRDAR